MLNMEETVTISKKEYEYLQNRDNILLSLEGAGVDNWNGWDEAMEILKELQKES